MKTFKQYITEGGNVTVGTVEAEPIKITAENRERKAKDVEDALHAVHDTFHQKHGEHLYGPNKQALHDSSALSGSTKHLLDKKIPHEEFAKHKPEVGDVDTKIDQDHGDALHAHLETGKKFGKYTVVGTKKSGAEIHALMKHEDGGVHQFDFEKTEYKNGRPTEFSEFGHSSDWEDNKAGIKGAHHKILLNAVGRDKHKFSNIHGLALRSDDPKKTNWMKGTHTMTHELFGRGANENDLHSFHGITKLIKKHLPPEEQQKVYDKFKSAVSKMKHFSHEPAINHLRKNLNVKD